MTSIYKSATWIISIVFIISKVLAIGESLVSEEIESTDNNGTDYQPGDLSVLMDLLARHYTPKCLRVVILSGNNNGSNSRPFPKTNEYIKALHMSQEDVKIAGKAFNTTYQRTQAQVVINAEFMTEAEETLQYINENTEKVMMFSCVTYLLVQPPDPRLLPYLTDSSSNMHLTRYFLIRAYNETNAENLLLDERLRKQENVATLTLVTAHNRTLWDVSIRQLLHPSGFPNVFVSNEWSLEEGFKSTNDIFPEQMSNFWGTKLKGVTLDFKPFTDYEKIGGSRVVRPKPSLDVFILDVIAQTLNFTYDLVMPEDGLWGFLNDDGHWVGVVGDVEFGRANFSLVLSLTLERLKSVDFTRSYYRDPLTFVSSKNRPSPQWRKLITPFSSNVWLLAMVSVCGGSILYHIIYRIQSLMESNSVTAPAFLDVFGSFLSQSLFVMPWISAGRVFLGAWFLYAFLVTTYYKTSLTAALAVPFVPPTIDTLEQLISSNLQYGMIDAKGSEYQLFSTSDVPLYQHMFEHMSYYSSSESMEKVTEGKYAYIYFKSNLNILVATQYSNANGESSLHVASEEFFPGGYSWAFPKGVPYRRTFDGVMWRCLQAGLVDKWLGDLYSIYLKETLEKKSPEEREKEKQEANKERTDGLVVLSLNHLQGPFFILFLGSTGGVILLLIELLTSRLFYSSLRELNKTFTIKSPTSENSDENGTLQSKLEQGGKYLKSFIDKDN